MEITLPLEHLSVKLRAGRDMLVDPLKERFAQLIIAKKIVGRACLTIDGLVYQTCNEHFQALPSEKLRTTK